MERVKLADFFEALAFLASGTKVLRTSIFHFSYFCRAYDEVDVAVLLYLLYSQAKAGITLPCVA